THAIQSLLGHGFVVIPGFVSLSDGSSRPATWRGYVTGQLPAPTTRMGCLMAMTSERSYCVIRPRPFIIPRTESRYGFSLFHRSAFGRSSAAATPAAAK